MNTSSIVYELKQSSKLHPSRNGRRMNTSSIVYELKRVVVIDYMRYSHPCMNTSSIVYELKQHMAGHHRRRAGV